MVAKFCSRSHGHPVCGVRRACMISIRREISRDGFMRRPYQTQTAAATEVAAAVDKLVRAGCPNALVPAVVASAAGLEQEPHAPFGGVNEVFQDAGGGDIL